MGLFSFLKDSGAKLFKKEEKISPEEARRQKIGLLRDELFKYSIEVKGLSLDLDDDKVTVFGQVESQADKERAILILGNVNGISAVEDKMTVVAPEPEAVFYEVKKGDSLSKIAKAHYGDAMKYPVIFEANKPMLKDPNLIYPGQVLRIPPLKG
jgi:nucleoid-associated protein YgaU